VLYSVYDLQTGLFTGSQVSGDAAFVSRNIPPGCAVMEGDHDHRRVRVDMRSMSLVTFQPPRPSDSALVTWHWDEPSWQWRAEPSTASKMGEVRETRNALLSASDWTQLTDVPLATKQAWADYRQSLRDITLQPDPFNIIWPTPPG